MQRRGLLSGDEAQWRDCLAAAQAHADRHFGDAPPPEWRPRGRAGGRALWAGLALLAALAALLPLVH